ncbi:MAG: RICIN domain-containing protein [Lachnospiraceae bacterium]|nr:RICIN domain-containing protein [Lachnospiraceae bacterium]
MFKKRSLVLVLVAAILFSLLPTNIGIGKVSAAAYDAETAGRRVVGYLPSYRTYALDSIDFSAMTHCNLAFMTYSYGTLNSNFSAGDVQNIVNKCHANHCKAIIAIGGWGGFQNDGAFTTAAKRTAFVNQVMNYVNTYNLDGVDIDIELEDADIWNNFDALISELSGRLKSQGKLLTMAVSPWFTGSISNSTYNYFDFLNLMSYDYIQNGTGEVAPWSQIYDLVSYYGSRGVSNDRLVIGVPFYGYSTAGAFSYAQMVESNPANAYQDYANGVYYNGLNTIKQKAEYSKSYGGTMIWEVGQDSFGQYSLLKAIKEVMATGAPATEPSKDQPSNDQPTTGQPDNSASGDIYIYQDINYGGRSASLGLGNYNLASLQAKGFLNDDLSSLKVPFGYKVTLYADDNFSGTAKVITGDTAWIGNDFNDKTSSIRVERAKYRIINRHSGLALDVSGANTANGANVQQWTPNGTDAQSWYVSFNNDDSTYVITSALNNKALDMADWSTVNGGNLIMWDNNNTNNQRWYITGIDNGYCFFINKHSNKAMDVAEWSTASGGNVHQWDYFAQANQQWRFEAIN